MDPEATGTDVSCVVLEAVLGAAEAEATDPWVIDDVVADGSPERVLSAGLKIGTLSSLRRGRLSRWSIVAKAEMEVAL